MAEAQTLAEDLKAEFKEKIKAKNSQVQVLEIKVKELEEMLTDKERRINELKDELEEHLQRTPGGRSDDSTDVDPYALYNEKRKVNNLLSLKLI